MPDDGAYASLKAIVPCCTLAFRGAFVSDQIFTPETLPRDFAFPLHDDAPYHASYTWLWLPAPPKPPEPPIIAEPPIIETLVFDEQVETPEKTGKTVNSTITQFFKTRAK